MNARIKKKIKKRDGYRKYNTYYIHKLFSLFPDDKAMKYMNHMICMIGNNIKHPHKIILFSNVYPIGISNVTRGNDQLIQYAELKKSKTEEMNNKTNSSLKEMNNKTNSSLKEMLNDWQKEILKNLEKENLKNLEKYIKEESD